MDTEALLPKPTVPPTDGSTEAEPVVLVTGTAVVVTSTTLESPA
jgi:hypothetical protein